MQFDNQADIYDKRTGLGDAVAKQIAQSVADLCKPFAQGMLLEVGAGTGEIGYFLQNITDAYVGLDMSQGMLDVYRSRYENVLDRPELLLADGNQAWPLADHCVSVIFSSRAMHQLNHEHVLQQLKRVCKPNALLILGNVKRSKKAAKTIMRQQMHHILNDYGLQEKSGQSNRKILFEELEELGGERLSSITAASWSVNNAPIDSINSWKNVDGIAGLPVDEALKNQVLDKLQDKAQDFFNDLNQPVESKETYELNAISLKF